MDKKELIEEFIKRPYDFIAAHYYEIDKNDLKDILLEVMANISPEEYRNIQKNIKEWLIEYKGWDI